MGDNVAMVGRDWFDWSGWVASVGGALLTVVQLTPLLRQHLQRDHIPPSAEVPGRKDRMVRQSSATSLVSRLLRHCGKALKLTLFAQPIVWAFGFTELSDIALVYWVYFGLAGLLIVSIWIRASWRMFREFQQIGNPWWIVPTSGALVTSFCVALLLAARIFPGPVHGTTLEPWLQHVLATNIIAILTPSIYIAGIGYVCWIFKEIFPWLNF